MQVQPLQAAGQYQQPAPDSLSVRTPWKRRRPTRQARPIRHEHVRGGGAGRDCSLTAVAVPRFVSLNWDVPIASINRLFLTHLHSDHIVQIPDLILAGWTTGRTLPLEVWGPDGTREMMDALQRAYAFDIHMRRDIDEKDPAEGIRVVSQDIKEGTVFDQQRPKGDGVPG